MAISTLRTRSENSMNERIISFSCFSCSGPFAANRSQRVANSKPRRDRVAALHPAEDPGNRAQILQAAAFAAARWSRTYPRMLQFVHRRGLLEILAARPRFPRCGAGRKHTHPATFLPWPSSHRRSAPGAGPPGRVNASSDAAIINSRFHSASTGSEYFQLSTSPCSVMRISPEKSPTGCARIARCVGPPPRPTVPPRPWKSRSFTPHSRATACSARCALCKFPRAGQHPAVFVRVRIAEHHFLAAAPGIEQATCILGAVHTRRIVSCRRAATRWIRTAERASARDHSPLAATCTPQMFREASARRRCRARIRFH